MEAFTYKRIHGPTIKQLNAIDLLVAGLNNAAVGEQIGVNRNTVTKWRLYDPTFQIALNQRRATLLAGATDGIRAVLPLLLDTVREQLSVGPRRDRLALDFLTRAGLIGSRGASASTPADPLAVGTTKLEDILDAEVRRARAQVLADLGTGEDAGLLPPVDAPVTPEEREAAYQHLASLAAEDPADPPSETPSPRGRGLG
jgi:hypothetical protein